MSKRISTPDTPAAIKPANGGPETSILISDSRFLPMTHYPVLQFPYIPWKEDGRWSSEQIDFEFWMSDRLPDKASKVNLKSGDQQELFNKAITCKRVGNEVRVQIHSRTTDRYFVICNSARVATRTMVEGKETEARFELQDENANPVELIVLKESDLQQSAEQGIVKHYEIKDLKFLKR